MHWIGDRGHFYYHTYAVEDHYYCKIEDGEIKLRDKDHYPDEWDRMNLDLAYQLNPVKRMILTSDRPITRDCECFTTTRTAT